MNELYESAKLQANAVQEGATICQHGIKAIAMRATNIKVRNATVEVSSAAAWAKLLGCTSLFLSLQAIPSSMT